MAFFKRAIAYTGYGALAGVGALAWSPRQSKIMTLPTTDYVYNTTFFARLNPDAHPAMGDVCVRRAKLSDIKPEHLTPEGKLAERFCAGVWSTVGKLPALTLPLHNA